MIQNQKNFPYYKEFAKKFPITENTVFVYDGVIYSDKTIPPDIEVHEKVHIKQQDKMGSKKWIKKYLKDDNFRLNQELEAYRVQVNFIKDKEAQDMCRQECAQNLSSKLYGNLISYEEVYEKLCTTNNLN